METQEVKKEVAQESKAEEATNPQPQQDQPKESLFDSAMVKQFVGETLKGIANGLTKIADSINSKE